MSRYDYQLNPQVLVWKERCEEQKRKEEELVECAFNYVRKTFEEKEREYQHTLEDLMNENRTLREKLGKLEHEMEFFNDLPWYEKMMYKFM